MKRIFIFFALCVLLISCAQKPPKILLYIRDGSADLAYMLTSEFDVMKRTLEESGFNVDIAVETGNITIESYLVNTPILKASDVIVSDYRGFILPCMAVGTNVPPEAVKMVEEAVIEGKPVAAQHSAVRILARSGALAGKRYTSYPEIDTNIWPDFKGAIYAGRGVVQDGNIITSGICPYMARMDSIQDGTKELTQKLVEVVNAGTKY